MKNIAMFYFSGTCNTEIISKEIKNNFISLGVNVSLYRIDNIIKQKEKVCLDEYDMIGIGFPIYGFNSPKLIRDFILSLPNVISKNAFIFTTAGSYEAINNGAIIRIRKMLNKKNYNVIYERIFAMGSNFFECYDDEFIKQLYLVALKKVNNMVSDIFKGKKRFVTQNIFLYYLSIIINWGSRLGGKAYGIFLKADDNCTKCMYCVNNCPSGNIRLKNNKISFGFDCIWCMKCIYSCPNNAIKQKALSFVVLKKKYDIKRIINDDSIKGSYVKEGRIGKYQHFLKYIKDDTK